MRHLYVYLYISKGVVVHQISEPGGPIFGGFTANNLQGVWGLVTHVAVCTCLVCCARLSGHSGAPEPAVSPYPPV